MNRKLMAAVLAAALALTGLTACGDSDSSSAADKSSQTASEADKTIDVNAAADRFKNEIKWVDTLNVLEDDMVEKITGVKADLYNSARIYVGAGGATAEEIAVFEAKDITAADNIKKAYEERIEAQKKAFENYVPGELVKLNDPLLTTAKNYVFVCISDDRSKAMEILSELI